MKYQRLERQIQGIAATTSARFRGAIGVMLPPMFRHALVALSMALAVSSALAQAPTPPPGEDWVSLFNGTDLAGWVEVGKEKWTVEDGVIHGQALTSEYG